MAKYDLELIYQRDQISIKGLEKNKRKLLSTLLYNESNVNFVNLKSLQKSFVDIDIPYIKNTVLHIFEDYHYFINDYSLINLVLHITIAIDGSVTIISIHKGLTSSLPYIYMNMSSLKR